MITELKKASWPSFIELRDSTVVVLLATVLLGTFIALSDFSLLNGVEFQHHLSANNVFSN